MKKQNNKYNPNAPETEEQDGLQSAKLRLFKAFQSSKVQPDQIYSSYPLLKNMQMTTTCRLSVSVALMEKGWNK